MIARLRSEWRRLVGAARLLDRQTAFVLTATGLLVVLQFIIGDRSFFRSEMAHLFPAAWQGIMAWGWWFSVQGVLGFVIPALSLLFIFKRRPSEIGLGLGDWKLASTIAVIYTVGAAVATWFLSSDPAFQAQYPHYQPAARDWTYFLIYEALFLFYWIGWEYLWRGFAIFGTAHTLGLYAIFVQAVPFAALHVSKPPAEAILSVIGGIALGALVWRCRSFWIAVPIHAAQMLLLDLWCALRIRTGIDGLGLGALLDMIEQL